MAKTQTKNPHPIIKILSDLNLLPEKGEDVDAESYKRAVRTAIITIEASSKDKAGDKRSRMLREEVKRIKELEREKIEVTPPKQEVKEKRTTIRGDKLMGRETKKDAPPTADKPLEKLFRNLGISSPNGTSLFLSINEVKDLSPI